MNYKRIKLVPIFALAVSLCAQGTEYNRDHLEAALKAAKGPEVKQAIADLIASIEERDRSRSLHDDLVSGVKYALTKAWRGEYDGSIHMIDAVNQDEVKMENLGIDTETIRTLFSQLDDIRNENQKYRNPEETFYSLYRKKLYVHFNVAYETRRGGWAIFSTGGDTGSRDLKLDLGLVISTVDQNAKGDYYLGLDPGKPEIDVRRESTLYRIYHDTRNHRRVVLSDEQIDFATKLAITEQYLVYQKSFTFEQIKRTLIRSAREKALMDILVAADPRLESLNNEYATKGRRAFDRFDITVTGFSAEDVPAEDVPQYAHAELEYAKQHQAHDSDIRTKEYSRILNDIRKQIETGYSRSRKGHLFRAYSMSDQVLVSLFNRYKHYLEQAPLGAEDQLKLKLSFNLIGGTTLNSVDDSFAQVLAFAIKKGEMQAADELSEARHSTPPSSTQPSQSTKEIVTIAGVSDSDAIDRIHTVELRSKKPYEEVSAVLVQLYQSGRRDLVVSVLTDISTRRKTESSRVSSSIDFAIEAVEAKFGSLQAGQRYERDVWENSADVIQTALEAARKTLEVEFTEFKRNPQILVGTVLQSRFTVYRQLVERLSQEQFYWIYYGKAVPHYKEDPFKEHAPVPEGYDYPEMEKVWVKVLYAPDEMKKPAPHEITRRNLEDFKLTFSPEQIRSILETRDL